MMLLITIVWYCNGSGTPSSSYSSFYIRPAVAAIRVAAATPPPVTDDDATAADDNDDYANEYDLTPAVSLFIEFRNRFGPYQLVP